MKILIHTLFFFLLATQICFGQWYQQNSPTTQNLNAVTFTDSNNGFAVGDNGIIVHTTNGGITWMDQTSNTDLKLFDVCFTDTNNGWAVGGNSNEYWLDADSSVILHTTDGGTNWLIEIGGVGYGCFYDCSFTDAYTGTIVGCYKDSIVGDPGPGIPVMLRTNDGGLSWIQQIPLVLENRHIWPTIHFSDENIGWLTEEVGSGSTHARIQKTTDGGLNWELQIEVPKGRGAILKRIKFYNQYIGFAVGSGFGTPYEDLGMDYGLMFFSTDGGSNWIDMDTSYLLHQALNDVSLSGTNIAIAVGDSGTILQASYSIGGWVEQTSNTDSCLNGVYFVDELIGWVVGDGGIILHTTNGGVSFVEEKDIDKIPTEFLLAQNYPNPFNPVTTFRYSIPQSLNVVIKVFDVLGSEIETLVNDEKPAGIYEVTWYAEQLPSGVYFYQIRAGEFNQTKKMLLLK